METPKDLIEKAISHAKSMTIDELYNLYGDLTYAAANISYILTCKKDQQKVKESEEYRKSHA